MKVDINKSNSKVYVDRKTGKELPDQWIYAAIESLNNEDIPREAVKGLKNAYSNYDTELRNRLKFAWEMNKIYIDDLAMDLDKHGNNPLYLVILHDKQLFETYVDRLGDRNMHKQIDEVVTQRKGNPYVGLRKIICDQ